MKKYWLLLILLPAIILGDLRSREVSSPGYYQGTIVDKVENMNMRYFMVDWDRVGRQTVPVHVMTFKRKAIGDSFSTQYYYSWILGASGSAYVPQDPNYGEIYGIVIALVRMFWIIALIAFVSSTMHHFAMLHRRNSAK